MSLRFLGMILKVLRLEVSVCNVHITNQFQPTFAQGGEGVKSVILEVTVNSKEENSEDFCPIYVQGFGLCMYVRGCRAASYCHFQSDGIFVAIVLKATNFHHGTNNALSPLSSR